jgi:hypothetical protein
MTPETLKPNATVKETGTKTSRNDAKSQVLEVNGLCVNCNLAENCMYLKSNASAVHYCEEFADAGPKAETKLRKVAPQLEPRGELKQVTGLKGLCVNCDLRTTCTHGITEGGVWHCENYL